MDETELPERTCIVTREQKPDAELIRFALSPDGNVTPDLKRKLPGRGVWVSRSKATLAEAVKRQAFGRGFGKEAKADPALQDLVSKLMRQELLAALSLANKAGLAIFGFMKVEEAAFKGHIDVLIHAKDAGTDGTEKLNRKSGENTVILDFFGTPELDLAFGRDNVVHAALTRGGQTQKLLDLARGFAQYENFTIRGLV